MFDRILGKKLFVLVFWPAALLSACEQSSEPKTDNVEVTEEKVETPKRVTRSTAETGPVSEVSDETVFQIDRESGTGIDGANSNYTNNVEFLLEDEEYSPEILDGRGVKSGYHWATVMIRTRRGAWPASTCSGVLIAKNVIISAAHCFDDATARRGSRVFVGNNQHVRNWERMPITRILWIKESKVHPDPNIDIALFRLNRNVVDKVKPTPLATDADIQAAKALRAVGYGYDDKDQLNRKNEADIAIASNFCEGQTKAGVPISNYFDCIAGKELVGGVVAPRDEYETSDCIDESRDLSFWEPGTEISGLCADTCNGDSGGPAFVVSADIASDREKYKNAFELPETYKLAAVTSRAVDTDHVPGWLTDSGNMCGNGGIYALISGDTRSWINDTIEEWAVD